MPSRFGARLRLVVCAVTMVLTELSDFDLYAATNASLSNPISNSPLEQFKAFVSTPPVIEDLAFRVKLDQNEKAKSTDGLFALSTNYAYFQARVQQGAVLLRQLANPHETNRLSVHGLFVSIFGPEFCLVDRTSFADHWVRNGGPSAQSPIGNIAHRRLNTLRQVLYLGVMHMDVGVIRWSGNNFEAECEPVARQFGMRKVSGELLASGNGPPEAMKVTYVAEKVSWNYLIKYTYDTASSFGWFPSKICSFLLRDNKEIELGEIVNFRFKIGERPLPATAFSPNEYIAANAWQPRFFTNNALYAKMPNGQLKLVATQSTEGLPIELPHGPSVATRAIAYCAWAGVNVGILVRIVRMKKMQRQSNSTQNEGKT